MKSRNSLRINAPPKKSPKLSPGLEFTVFEKFKIFETFEIFEKFPGGGAKFRNFRKIFENSGGGGGAKFRNFRNSEFQPPIAKI